MATDTELERLAREASRVYINTPDSRESLYNPKWLAVARWAQQRAIVELESLLCKCEMVGPVDALRKSVCDRCRRIAQLRDATTEPTDGD